MCVSHRLLFFCAFLAVVSLPLGAAPRVVTSIKPVDDLVRAVMQGVGEPVLLIPPGSSPHSYALKPSQRQAIEGADLLFWIGPEVETPLAKVVGAMPASARRITLRDEREMKLLPARRGGGWDASHAHASVGHAHASAASDGHLWLSPVNASAIIRAAARHLSAKDVANASRYSANAETALRRLSILDATLAAKLTPIRKSPFIVFHDAYQYFEHHYGLNAVGSVLISPDVMSSAGRIRALRTRMTQSGAICAFSEPQVEPRLLRTLIEGTPTRSGELDPLGARLDQGLAGYEQLLNNLADNLLACLARQ